MKRLILMRHAKSSWGDPDEPDHDRPLNRRGQHSAEALGGWLRDNNYRPDQVLSSTATRTRETLDRVRLTAQAEFVDALYLAGAERMLAVLRQAKGDSVLMLGHNPGIAGLAQALVVPPPDHSRFFDYPTCATLVANFEIADWADLAPGTGRVRDFVIPRELTG